MEVVGVVDEARVAVVAVAQWGPVAARWGLVVARWGLVVVRWDPAAARWDPAVVRWDPAAARWDPAAARWDPAVVRWDPAVVVEAQVAHLLAEVVEDRRAHPHLTQWLHCPSGRACSPRVRRCMTFQ